MDTPVIIFGAGETGKSALDIFKSNGVDVFCFLDDDESMKDKEIDGISVMGSMFDDGYLKYIGKKCSAFVALDTVADRKEVVEMLNERRKVMPVNAVHKSAVLSESAWLEHGVLVSAGVIINAGARVESHVSLHTGSIVDTGAKVGAFTQVGAGVTIGAGVEIAEDVFIGAGATLIPGVKIGKGASIGAGSVVIGHVEDNAKLFGNPAKEV